MEGKVPYKNIYNKLKVNKIFSFKVLKNILDNAYVLGFHKDLDICLMFHIYIGLIKEMHIIYFLKDKIPYKFH